MYLQDEVASRHVNARQSGSNLYAKENLFDSLMRMPHGEYERTYAFQVFIVDSSRRYRQVRRVYCIIPR